MKKSNPLEGEYPNDAALNAAAAEEVMGWRRQAGPAEPVWIDGDGVRQVSASHWRPVSSLQQAVRLLEEARINHGLWVTLDGDPRRWATFIYVRLPSGQFKEVGFHQAVSMSRCITNAVVQAVTWARQHGLLAK